MSTYAKKDEVVTCSGGHPIFKFTKDIISGELHDFENQVKWLSEDTKEPLPGEIIPRCKCGCPFISFWGEFHFKDGWR